MRIDRLARVPSSDTLWRATLVVLLLVTVATASADTVRVTEDRALVWTRPVGVSFVVTQLSKGTVVEVLRRVGDWYEILLPSGTSGVNRTGFIRVTQVAIESVEPLSLQAARLAAGARPRPATKPSTFLSIDVVRRWPSDDLTRSSTAFADTYAEDGSIAANYGGNFGWTLDALIGQTVWGPIGVGIGASYYLRKEPATVDAHVPHPFFFDQRRSAAFKTSPLVSREVALHIPAIWMLAPQGRLRLMVFGGLSIFRVSQHVVTDLTLDDPYPHDAVTIDGAITEERTGTGVGFHAGADVSYFFSRSVGLGAGARYSHATFAFEKDAGATTTGVAGAAQAVAGLRFRF